tara:strand:- start:217 stop:678 length:462 start_codon:yes stop_codon:yes gene_type:complete
MANSTIVGQATIYGVDGTVAYGTVIGADSYLQSVSLTDEADTTEARDQKGNVFGYNLYNFRRTCTFEIIFVDSTEAGAAGELKIPSGGALVTIAQDTETGSTMPVEFIGDWNYISGATLSGSNTDLMRMMIPCSQYNADTAGSAVTTLASFTH